MLAESGAVYAPCMRSDIQINSWYAAQEMADFPELGCCEVTARGRAIAGTTSRTECQRDTNGETLSFLLLSLFGCYDLCGGRLHFVECLNFCEPCLSRKLIRNVWSQQLSKLLNLKSFEGCLRRGDVQRVTCSLDWEAQLSGFFSSHLPL